MTRADRVFLVLAAAVTIAACLYNVQVNSTRYQHEIETNGAALRDLGARVEKLEKENEFLRHACTKIDETYGEAPIPVSELMLYKDIEIERRFILIERKIGMTEEDYKNIE